MKKLAIVMAAWNETGIENLIDQVLREIPKEYSTSVFVAVNNSNESFAQEVEAIASARENVTAVQCGDTAPRTFAVAYLRGLQTALGSGAEFIIEMDGNGAHHPRYLPQFLAKLEAGADAVLSTRFLRRGSGIVNYPRQRFWVSLGGTILANLVLSLGRFVPDMSSGYEAFRTSALDKILALAPMENWISVNQNPGYFYQTEMRTYFCWLGARIEVLPIIWGEESTRVYSLNTGQVLDALSQLSALKHRKRDFLARLKSQT